MGCGASVEDASLSPSPRDEVNQDRRNRLSVISLSLPNQDEDAMSASRFIFILFFLSYFNQSKKGENESILPFFFLFFSKLPCSVSIHLGPRSNERRLSRPPIQ